MYKYFLIIILFFAVNEFAQDNTPIKLDEKTIVKNNEGLILPYVTWTKLLKTGEYNLSKIDGILALVIYKMSDAEKASEAEIRKNRMGTMPKPSISDAFIAGEIFKGEKITVMNGNTFDLKMPLDKIYVINFWFINCPPCKDEIPDLNKIVEKYKDNKNVVFLAIALDSSSDLKQFLKATPFNYNIVDDGRYYAKKYGVKGYPTHVIVGKDGLIKFSTVGLTTNTAYWIEKTIKEQTEL